MKATLVPAALSFCLAASHLSAQDKASEKEPEKSPEMVGLEKTAKDFVAAYNKKDAAAVAALFTETGEITDRDASDITSGRDDIKARYEAIFAAPKSPKIALQVDSVRIIGKGLAIEDGTVHSTPPGSDVPSSMSYSAVLQKNDAGVWLIASSRDMDDVSDAAGELAGLAADLKGDWTAEKDGMRLDLAFDWDESGKYLMGDMLTTAADAEPLRTSIRIGWDAGSQAVTWWTFDDRGGFAKGVWTSIDDDTWLIRTEGTTADGEAMSANQTLSFEGNDAFTWKSSDRLVDGEKQEDVDIRVVHQTPEPGDQ